MKREREEFSGHGFVFELEGLQVIHQLEVSSLPRLDRFVVSVRWYLCKEKRPR
jgi:hypothetical protein